MLWSTVKSLARTQCFNLRQFHASTGSSGIVNKLLQPNNAVTTIFKSKLNVGVRAISTSSVRFAVKEETLDQSLDKFNPTEFFQEGLATNYDPIDHVNLARGKTGVFDLDELVQLLQDENALDICVISVPNEMKYVDYLILVTAKSTRHLQALGAFVRQVFKRKNLKPSDILPDIEGGKRGEGWIALDLGNIALHIFQHEKRLEVDLETLWTVGPQFDDITNQKDPTIVQLLGTFNVSDLDVKTR